MQSASSSSQSTPAPPTSQSGLSPNTTIPSTASAAPPTAESQREPRTTRACEACRGLKIRCVIDPGNPSGPCQRCLRYHHQCIHLPINRKRRKRADTRVNELEKKMEQLARVVASKNADSKPLESQPQQQQQQTPRIGVLGVLDDKNTLQVLDPIEHNALDEPTAYRLFEFWRKEMSGLLPMIMLPPSETFEGLRRNHPLLFLAILSVAAGIVEPDIHDFLRCEVFHLVGNRVFVAGSPSVEVIKTILVLSSHHSHPRTQPIDDRSFNYIIHAAATMAMDTGMGRRTGNSRKMFQDLTEGGPVRMNPNSPVVRRMWVGIYFTCSV